MASNKRKWMDSYVEFGFTRAIVSDGVDRVTCYTILGNASLKPSPLKTHQERSHPGLQETLPSLELKRARYDQRGTLLTMGVVPLRRPLLHVLMKWHYSVRTLKSLTQWPKNWLNLVPSKWLNSRVMKMPLSNRIF